MTVVTFPNITGVVSPNQTVTFAALPTAANAKGQQFFVSDVGVSGSLWYSDGTVWKPVGGRVTLGSSAVATSMTGTTATETTLGSCTVKGTIMGLKGILEIESLWAVTNSGNNKEIFVRFGGTGGNAFTDGNVTTILSLQHRTTIQNRDSASSQVGWAQSATGGFTNSTSANRTGVVNTAVDQDILFRGLLNNSGETIQLDRWKVDLVIP